MCSSDDNQDSPGGNREADERLIHALLLHLHDDQANTRRDERVQRAIQAIRQPGPSDNAGYSEPATLRPKRTLKFSTWSRRLTYAAAAAVLIVVGFIAVTYDSKPAMASLTDILGALGKPGDRTYHITLVDLPEPPDRRPPDDDRPPDDPERVPRPNLDDAKLYLRDANQYVLERHDPNGNDGMIFDGYDGKQSWRVTRGKLAETREGLGAGGIPIPPMMADIPFTDLHGALERIQVDYTVEKFELTSMASGGENLRHVFARRKSHEIRGPETIEIWANTQSGMPKRIIFDDAKIQGNRTPCRLTFDLVTQEPLPTNWFSPQPHLASGM